MQMSVATSIAFWIMAAATVISAVSVVMVKDMFHAVLFLVVSFLAVAGLFVTLNADFVAVAQVLIYAGAIAILLIFALLLTKNVQQANQSNRITPLGIFLGLVLFLTIAVALSRGHWAIPSQAPLQAPLGATTEAIADSLFNTFVLPFEIAAVLLLAAIIGAIVLAREEE